MNSRIYSNVLIYVPSGCGLDLFYAWSDVIMCWWMTQGGDSCLATPREIWIVFPRQVIIPTVKRREG